MAMTTSIDPLRLLHEIVIFYGQDAGKFYSQADQSARKFVGRYNFKDFAKKFFDPIPKNEVVNTYLLLLETCQEYMIQHRKSHVGIAAIRTSYISIPELVLSMILPYQLPSHKKQPAAESEATPASEETAVDEEDSSGDKKRRRKTMEYGPRVEINVADAKKLLEHFLHIPLNAETKVWKQIKYILCPSGNPDTLKQFGEVIATSTANGHISYSALSFFMKDQLISRQMKDPTTILHALYLGPLQAETVEMFAANRSEEFRSRCREALALAVRAQQDPMNYKLRTPINIPDDHPEKLKYRDFAQNTTQLLRDLNGEFIGDNSIHAGWACAAIKKFGKKTYVDKAWKDENFYDLVWTILAQRPNLKKYVCDVLEKQFNDYGAAKFWRRMQPYQMNRTAISNRNVVMENPLTESREFLNFPPCVKDIKVISKTTELESLIRLLDANLRKHGRITVGLDAEWSAYTAQSRATILQLATYDTVYIIDLDSRLIDENCLKFFFDKLFLEKNILKIGFQFAEDLHQLRSLLRTCVALYRPNNVVCVGKIFQELLSKAEKESDFEQLKKRILPYIDVEVSKNGSNNDSFVEETKAEAEETMDSISEMQSSSESTKENNNKNNNGNGQGMFLNKGLSFLCEKVLGRPLDKTEQCSVWDRRPLRNLQLRYAAMDAYCMLMLWDKCIELCTAMDVNVDEMLEKQSPIRVSLPLLSESSLPTWVGEDRF